MESYLRAWKTFRRLSNENAVTADHLIRRPLWPRHDQVVVADIGCGDGRMLESITDIAPGRVAEVRLLDPNEPLLGEASARLRERQRGPRVSTHLGTLQRDLPEYAVGADAALLIHVVYFIAPADLAEALGSFPLGVPLYVVLDAEDSLFSTLWRRTASEYRRRAVGANALMRELPQQGFDVELSTIRSALANPLEEAQPDVLEGLLSILSYTDVSRCSPRLRAWIETTIGDRVQGGVLQCESNCYQIVRRTC